MSGFAELAARSHYSFLEGAASPRKMVETAARLGISALGLCDRNGLYGAVELIQAAKAQGIHPIIGTELELAGGSRLRLLARSRIGYRQLCRAVSASQLAGVKGQPRLEIAGIATGAVPVNSRECDPDGSCRRGDRRARARVNSHRRRPPATSPLRISWGGSLPPASFSIPAAYCAAARAPGSASADGGTFPCWVAGIAVEHLAG